MPQVRYQLTIAQLAEFDDLLTDALVDRVYYWTTIRKTKHLYHPNRGVKTDAVVRIIVDDVVRNKSVTAAQKAFLELGGVQTFMRKLGKNENLKNDFIRHARRYISMYMPDAPFEVSATNRYTLTGQEACVLARRPISKGDTIKYLTGAMLKMSPEEEKACTEGQTDFSIIYSSRVGGMSLLLGPARFVNHDCKPNAKFVTSCKDNIQLTVLRDIEIGEEVTVTYAEGYFGEDNRECLCRSCEKEVRNGWAQDEEDASGQGNNSAEEDDTLEDAPEMVRTRSKRKSVGRGTSEPTPPPAKKAKRKPAKLEMLTPPDSDRSNSEDGGLNTLVAADTDMQTVPAPDSFAEAPTPAPEPEETVANHTPIARNTPITREHTPIAKSHLMRHHTPLSSISIADPKLDAADALLTLHRSPTGYNPAGSPLFHSHQRMRSFDRAPSGQFGAPLRARSTSFVESPLSGSPSHYVPHRPSTGVQIGPVKVPSPIGTPFFTPETSMAPAVKTEPIEAVTTERLADIPTEEIVPKVENEEGHNSDSDLSEISDSELEHLEKTVPIPPVVKDEPNQQDILPAKKSHKKQPPALREVARRKSMSVSAAPGSLEITRKRVPGDYLTFFDSDSIKLTCQDCKEEFIHPDRWYIPRSCKRCERHSKIYGLIWPKTTKRKGDEEDQIDDPRKIQRYVTANEHRKELKKLEEANKVLEIEKARQSKKGGKRKSVPL